MPDSTFVVRERATALYQATLKDEAGVVIPSSAIATLTLTLRNAADDAIINGRDAQNVLNANGVTVHATSGLLVWTMTPADNAIQDDTLPNELHLALFEFTYSTTKGGHHEVALTVQNRKKVP